MEPLSRISNFKPLRSNIDLWSKALNLNVEPLSGIFEPEYGTFVWNLFVELFYETFMGNLCVELYLNLYLEPWWNLGTLSVEPSFGTSGNLNLHVEPLWNLILFKCGTSMWNLGEPWGTWCQVPATAPKPLRGCIGKSPSVGGKRFQSDCCDGISLHALAVFLAFSKVPSDLNTPA